jgi:hypothetical protein
MGSPLDPRYSKLCDFPFKFWTLGCPEFPSPGMAGPSLPSCRPVALLRARAPCFPCLSSHMEGHSLCP